MLVWLDSFEVFAPTDPSHEMKDSSREMKDSSPGMKDPSQPMKDSSTPNEGLIATNAGWFLHRLIELGRGAAGDLSEID